MVRARAGVLVGLDLAPCSRPEPCHLELKWGCPGKVGGGASHAVAAESLALNQGASSEDIWRHFGCHNWECVTGI